MGDPRTGSLREWIAERIAICRAQEAKDQRLEEAARIVELDLRSEVGDYLAARIRALKGKP